MSELAVGGLFGAGCTLRAITENVGPDVLPRLMAQWAEEYAAQCRAARGHCAIIGVDTPISRLMWPKDGSIPKIQEKVEGARLSAALSVLCPDYQILGVGPTDSLRTIESAMALSAEAFGVTTCACFVDPHLYDEDLGIPIASAEIADLSNACVEISDRLSIPVWIAGKDAPCRAADLVPTLYSQKHSMAAIPDI
jgi:hypothetical protein